MNLGFAALDMALSHLFQNVGDEKLGFLDSGVTKVYKSTLQHLAY
jgi:hypothetical protein